MEPSDRLSLDDPRKAGVGARVLREVIRTPAFLEIIEMHTRELDPEDARSLVRTLLWEDPALALGLAGLTPQVVNYLAAAVLELAIQMNVYPGALLEQFMAQASSGIDSELILQYPKAFGALIEKAGLGESIPVATGRVVSAAAAAVVNAEADNPLFLRDVLGQVQGRELLRAALAVGRSAVRWLFSGISNLTDRKRSDKRTR